MANGILKNIMLGVGPTLGNQVATMVMESETAKKITLGATMVLAATITIGAVTYKLFANRKLKAGEAEKIKKGIEQSTGTQEEVNVKQN